MQCLTASETDAVTFADLVVLNQSMEIRDVFTLKKIFEQLNPHLGLSYSLRSPRVQAAQAMFTGIHVSSGHT